MNITIFFFTSTSTCLFLIIRPFCFAVFFIGFFNVPLLFSALIVLILSDFCQKQKAKTSRLEAAGGFFWRKPISQTPKNAVTLFG